MKLVYLPCIWVLPFELPSAIANNGREVFATRSNPLFYEFSFVALPYLIQLSSTACRLLSKLARLNVCFYRKLGLARFLTIHRVVGKNLEHRLNCSTYHFVGRTSTESWAQGIREMRAISGKHGWSLTNSSIIQWQWRGRNEWTHESAAVTNVNWRFLFMNTVASCFVKLNLFLSRI